jgi:hypothetical protein
MHVRACHVVPCRSLILARARARQVSTSFVEADIAPELSDLSCVEYVQSDARVKAMGVTEQQVVGCAAE